MRSERASGGKAAAPAKTAKPTPKSTAKAAGKPLHITIRKLPDFSWETMVLTRGLGPVAGVDEAGRGPLAGPVVAAAVVLDPARIPQGLDDSKMLPRERREALYEEVMATAHVSVACVSAALIDEINILRASLEAMRRALAALALQPGFIYVDGRDMPAWAGQGEAVIGGDGIVASIAAASIVAKVTRDRTMARLGLHYPAYGFEQHAGYATPTHRRALDRHGPCPFHRMTFGSVAALDVNEE
jgi:ribonuclease HII